jgi:LysM repeat protein
MRKYFLWFIAVAFLFLSYRLLPARKVSAHPSAQNVAPTPSQIIEAVNALRLAHGIAPLSVHPVLMQVAQYQAEGGGGHWRPEGITLGQWLISLGYPLSGDLSLDGYRSENWGFAQTAEEAITMWLSDDEHTNTMLSVNRSDIGAAVAVTDGSTYIIVIETALQTNSGQQQSDAYVIMTGIPLTQAANSGMSTQAAKNGLLPQYIVPVAINTADADGNVYHDVKYGQTLWSIAIAYRTTIKQIQQLNSLVDTIVRPGQHLLVMKGATQSAPREASITGTVVLPTLLYSTPAVSFTRTATPENVPELTPQEKQKNIMGVVAIGVAALFLGGLFTVITRKKTI